MTCTTPDSSSTSLEASTWSRQQGQYYKLSPRQQRDRPRLTTTEEPSTPTESSAITSARSCRPSAAAAALQSGRSWISRLPTSARRCFRISEAGSAASTASAATTLTRGSRATALPAIRGSTRAGLTWAARSTSPCPAASPESRAASFVW